MGTLVFFPGVKRPERDGDHPHSAEVNNWSHVSFRLCDFMAWRGEARSVARKSWFLCKQKLVIVLTEVFD
jgi:hypothetical protein